VLRENPEIRGIDECIEELENERRKKIFAERNLDKEIEMQMKKNKQMQEKIHQTNEKLELSMEFNKTLKKGIADANKMREKSQEGNKKQSEVDKLKMQLEKKRIQKNSL